MSETYPDCGCQPDDCPDREDVGADQSYIDRGDLIAHLLHDTARLGDQTFACRYDKNSGDLYTYAPLAFVAGGTIDLPDRHLLIDSVERAAGVTRIKTHPA